MRKKLKTDWHVLGILAFIIVFWAVVIFLVSCAPAKVVEQHHHHYYVADTLAMQNQVDAHLHNNTAMIDSMVNQVFSQYTSEWSSNENEKETVTETITTTVDSLGRQIRTEQRITERNLSRQQQQTEERLTQEFEQRLQRELSTMDSTWQSRMEKIQAHWEQNDSTSSTQQPVGDQRPWYKRWWSRIEHYLLLAAVVVIAWLTRAIWWPILRNTFKYIAKITRIKK